MIVFSLILIVVLAICVVKKNDSPEEKTDRSFLAVVTEVNDETIYIKPVEESVESKSYNGFTIFKSLITDESQPQVGDTYKIVYWGGIAESDPPEILGIESVTREN